MKTLFRCRSCRFFYQSVDLYKVPVHYVRNDNTPVMVCPESNKRIYNVVYDASPL